MKWLERADREGEHERGNGNEEEFDEKAEHGLEG